MGPPAFDDFRRFYFAIPDSSILGREGADTLAA
jgi:hypothetical protein